MVSKLINNYLHKDEAKILEQNNNLTIPIKFIAKYENRILKSKSKISYVEFLGNYLYSDLPIRQPVEAFLFADLLRSNYGVENPTDYIITHAVALAKVVSLDDEPCNTFFLGESIKLVKKNTCVCAVRNDWYHILDTADEVWAKLSNYNDEFQKDQIAYLLFNKGDGEPYNDSFVPNTQDVDIKW